MSAVETYNQEVGDWGRDTLRQTRNAVLRLCVSHGAGYVQQHVATKLYAGEASKIVFDFPLHMVFVHKGAGRGYGGSKSGKFTNAGGSKTDTAKGSFGKMGTGKRVPKPWFNPVLEAQFPALAELVQNYHAEKIVLNLQRVLID